MLPPVAIAAGVATVAGPGRHLSARNGRTGPCAVERTGRHVAQRIVAARRAAVAAVHAAFQRAAGTGSGNAARRAASDAAAAGAIGRRRRDRGAGLDDVIANVVRDLRVAAEE